MACPAVSVLVANAVAPSLKVTVPVGVPLVPLTAAVNVTDWPNTEGFSEELTVVVVEPLLTVCVNAAEVLLVKVASPLYTTVIECEPVAREDMVKVAWPPLRALVASAVAPSLNVTVPVGVPLVPVTVAVNVTDCPNTEGFCEELTMVVVEDRVMFAVVVAVVLK